MSLTKNSLIKIAKILKPHGIKGEVKILPFTDDIDRFSPLTENFTFLLIKVLRK